MNNKFIHKTEKTQRYTEEHLKGKKDLMLNPNIQNKETKHLQPPWLKLSR